MIKEYIGIVSGALSLIAYGLYIYTMWRGNTRPSRSSYWILSVVWTVVLISSISLAPGATKAEQWHALSTRWLSIAYIAGSLIIAISSIWRGAKERWGWADYVCAICALVALYIFVFTNNPILSFILAIVADFFGIIPTIKNAWNYPQNEDKLAWMIECVASCLALFAVSNWAFSFAGASDWATPIYLAILNGVITALIVRKYFTSSKSLH